MTTTCSPFARVKGLTLAATWCGVAAAATNAKPVGIVAAASVTAIRANLGRFMKVLFEGSAPSANLHQSAANLWRQGLTTVLFLIFPATPFRILAADPVAVEVTENL